LSQSINTITEIAIIGKQKVGFISTHQSKCSMS